MNTQKDGGRNEVLAVAAASSGVVSLETSLLCSAVLLDNDATENDSVLYQSPVLLVSFPGSLI